MTEVAWSWINGGASFDLPGMPIAGRQEIIGMESEHSEWLAEFSQATFYQQCVVALAAKKILDEWGVEQAKRVWDEEGRQYFVRGDPDALLWDKGEWEQAFNAWVQKNVLSKLGTNDPKEALDQVQAALKDVRWEKLADVTTTHRMSSFATSIHWRLKQKFDTITVPGEGEVPLTRENLEKVLKWPEDEAKVREAERKRGVGEND